MAQNDGLRRYLEAGLALTQITRARAEELVHELIQAGEVETTRAQDWVEDLVKTSRDRSDVLLSTVRGEVRSQLSDLGITNVDDLAHRVAELLDRAESSGTARHQSWPGPWAHGDAQYGAHHHGQEGTGAQGDGQEVALQERAGQEGGRQRHQGQEGTGAQDGGQEGDGDEGGRPVLDGVQGAPLTRRSVRRRLDLELVRRGLVPSTRAGP